MKRKGKKEKEMKVRRLEVVGVDGRREHKNHLGWRQLSSKLWKLHTRWGGSEACMMHKRQKCINRRMEN